MGGCIFHPQDTEIKRQGNLHQFSTSCLNEYEHIIMITKLIFTLPYPLIFVMFFLSNLMENICYNMLYVPKYNGQCETSSLLITHLMRYLTARQSALGSLSLASPNPPMSITLNFLLRLGSSSILGVICDLQHDSP